MYRTSDFRGTVCDGIRFANQRGSELYNAICNTFPEALESEGVPFYSRTDEVKSGGLFGSVLPMLVISHPNPPSSFFSIGIVVNDNVVSFPLLGESTENTKANKKEALLAEGKLIRAAMVNPDEFVLQQEKSWQASVIDVFARLVE
ncbi:MAG: hypothetical protein E7428_10990 [Ruminococcaceae bacterium]|nr:hypothetical protein [Oscillospiraceae bacterium]